MSPFDNASSCLTCGLTSNYCPGHHGHIELVAPLYNPFMIKELYRLMKAKCFHCHRLRVPDAKLVVLTNALKFIKAGEILGSQKIKAHFFALAKEVTGLKTSESEDGKKVAKLTQMLNQMMASHSRKKAFSEETVKEQLKLVQRRFNIEREKFEHDIIQLLEAIEMNKKPDETNKLLRSGMTSIIQKFQLDLVKEMWSNVVTTRCPHCKQNSPAFRKDGYTKMFVKPLAGKAKQAQDQRKRLGSEVEARTVASTTVNGSRKASTLNEEELSEISEEERENLANSDSEMDEEYKEGGQQKFISPTEVKEHIHKLWRKEGDLLNLVYGKFEPEEDGKPFEVTSLGEQLFFIDQALVPPTRFRPESEGAHGGAGGGQGRAYLHTHSAMLLKIMTCNEAMKDALLEQGRADSQSAVDKAGKLGFTTQKWI